MNGRSLVTKSVGRVINYFEVDVKSFNNGLYILNLEFEDESAKLSSDSDSVAIANFNKNIMMS